MIGPLCTVLCRFRSQPRLFRAHPSRSRSRMDASGSKTSYRSKTTIRREKGHWDVQANRLEFLNGLAEIFGVSEPSHWYLVPRRSVEKHGGAGLLAHFEKSLAQTLLSVFPSHEWHWWKFREPPRHLPEYSYSPEHVHLLCQEIGSRELGVARLSDWYSKSQTEINSTHGTRSECGLLVQCSYWMEMRQWAFYSATGGTPV